MHVEASCTHCLAGLLFVFLPLHSGNGHWCHRRRVFVVHLESLDGNVCPGIYHCLHGSAWQLLHGLCKDFKSLLCLNISSEVSNLCRCMYSWVHLSDQQRLLQNYTYSSGWHPLKLHNQPWHHGFQLVNRDVIARFFDNQLGYLVDCAFHSPWFSCGLSRSTGTADWCSLLS